MTKLFRLIIQPVWCLFGKFHRTECWDCVPPLLLKRHWRISPGLKVDIRVDVILCIIKSKEHKKVLKLWKWKNKTKTNQLNDMRDLFLCCLNESVNVNHGLGELLHSSVQLMVAIEACSQSWAADQSKERETTADGPRFSLLQNINISVSEPGW